MDEVDVDDIHGVAAQWQMRMDRAPVAQDDRLRFETWLSESSDHRDAYDQVRAALDDVDTAIGTPEIDALMSEMRERIAPPAPSRRFAPMLAAAAAVMLAMLGAVYFLLSDTVLSQGSVETLAGQRRIVALDDGSRVSLDAGTRLSFRFTDDARALVLERGQARFQVAHDGERPFTVVVAERTVTATGTDFNVERLASRSIVTLLQGGVLVGTARKPGLFDRLRHEDPASSVRMYPGDRLDVSDDGRVSRSHTKAEDVLAWQQGRVVFDDETLSVAVERFNRYSDRKLMLKGSGLGGRRISGAFDLSRPDVFAEAVAQFFGLKTEGAADRGIVLTTAG